MARYPRSLLQHRALRPWSPQSGVEQSQGSAYPTLPGVQEKLQIPSDPGIEVKGWRNPYQVAQYGFDVPDQTVGAASIKILAGNPKRAYFLIQNKGPGNLFVSFGYEASTNGDNCIALVQTQVYELIGGGGVFPDRDSSLAASFVMRDSVYVLSDAATTRCVVLEGVWTDAQVYK